MRMKSFTNAMTSGLAGLVLSAASGANADVLGAVTMEGQVESPVEGSAMAAKASKKTMAAKSGKSLYERLGGIYSIAAVVDDFTERLVVNPTITANSHVKDAMGRINKAGLKYHLTAQVCMVTGGPCAYTGRAMLESHKHLQISQGEWDAMAGDFKATLDKFKVPKAEQDELFAIVGTTKKDIVMAAKGKK